MAHFIRGKKYIQDKPIYSSVNGIEKPYSAQITRDMISADSNGVKALPAGVFVSKQLDVNGVESFRVLPRAKVKTATSLASNLVEVENPYVFVSGDVLYVIETYGKVDVATVGGTGTLTLKGRTFSFTPTGAADTTEAAAQYVTAINASTVLSRYVRAVSIGAVIWLFAKDGYSQLEITPDGTNLQNQGATKTDPVVTTPDTVAVGTVSTVNTSGQVVLTANAATVVPVGTNVGTLVNEVYGMIDTSFELTDQKATLDAALTTAGYVYRGSLPYYDDTIAVDLPDLHVSLKN